MQFENVSYLGPPVDDTTLLAELPSELADVLQQANGLVAGSGAFHLRGVCREPAWHSLIAAWRGPSSVATWYRSVIPSDIPFAEDALGDRYFWREGTVWCLSAESDEAEEIASSLTEFLEQVSASPVEYLRLGPLVAFWEEGGTLAPGQLLSVYPPIVVRSDTGKYSYRAVSTADRLGALAGLAAQIRDLPEGTAIRITTREAAG